MRPTDIHIYAHKPAERAHDHVGGIEGCQRLRPDHIGIGAPGAK
jgi:hypothetical protein